MTRLKLTAAVLVLAGVAAFLTDHAAAFATYGSWTATPVYFVINPQNLDVSPDAAETAILSAMDTWNAVPNSKFRFAYAGRTGATTSSYDNQNVIVFRPDGDGSEIARTYSWQMGSTIVDSDIVFWDGPYTFFTGTSGCGGSGYGVYIEDVATHELGHALGLLHSDVPTATMYPGYPACSIDKRWLDPDDIAAIQSLYPGTTSNTAPSVTISAPSGGTSFASTTSISFSGSASDAQDGNISGKLVWTSNLVGTIGSGGSFSTTLPAGSHIVTASVVDSGGLKASKQISITVTASTNTAPAVTISTPTATSFPYGASISFAGSASDTQDGNLTSRLVWSSNLVGQIGTGGAFAVSLPSGSQVITASVTDSGGLTSSKQISINVGPLNTNPSVMISSPTSTTYESGTLISFAGSASDSEDGNLTSRMVWTSSLLGQFGTGGSFSMTLTSGTHVITASVTDSGGLTSSQQVTVSISSPVTSTVTFSPTLSATAYKVKGNQRADLVWTGSSATTIDVFRNGTRINTVPNTGAWTDLINNKGGGSYRYKICNTGTSSCSNEVQVSF